MGGTSKCRVVVDRGSAMTVEKHLEAVLSSSGASTVEDRGAADVGLLAQANPSTPTADAGVPHRKVG